MSWRKELLKECCVYGIIDRKCIGQANISSIFKAAIDSGIKINQLRDKFSSRKIIFADACKVKIAIKNRSSLFIINDYSDIAAAVEADGVHLGQEDLPVKVARKILGRNKLIGISCHSIKQALYAQNDGADYIGLGPIYATETKPEYHPKGLGLIRSCSKKIRIPVFVIGGINAQNIVHVAAAGARRIAACRVVCEKSIRNTEVKRITQILNKS